MISSLFFNLLLVSFAMADEMAASAIDNTWKYGTSGGVLGFIVLILDIMVFMEILKSNRPPSHKLLWCVVVFLFPILGLIFYWLFSNRSAHAGSGSYEAIP